VDILDRELSKIKKVKYVYYVNCQIHIEEYPVVYTNSEWFYYVKDKRGQLSYERMSRLHDEYEPKYGMHSQFCLNVDKTKIPGIERAIEINQLKAKINTVKKSIEAKESTVSDLVKEHINLGRKLAELETEQEIASKPSIDTP
jgi:hypothetical protein